MRCNAHKVTAANDRHVGNLVEAVFGAGGLIACAVRYDAPSYTGDAPASGAAKAATVLRRRHRAAATQQHGGRLRRMDEQRLREHEPRAEAADAVATPAPA